MSTFEYLKKKRSKFTRDQTKFLEDYFNLKNSISVQEREQVAKQIGLTSREVQVWFQNRRAKVNKAAKQLPESLEMRKRQMINVRVRKTSSGVVVFPSPTSPREMILPEIGSMQNYTDILINSHLHHLTNDESTVVSRSLDQPTYYNEYNSYSLDHPALGQIQQLDLQKKLPPLPHISTDFLETEREDDLFDLFHDPFNSPRIK